MEYKNSACTEHDVYDYKDQGALTAASHCVIPYGRGEACLQTAILRLLTSTSYLFIHSYINSAWRPSPLRTRYIRIVALPWGGVGPRRISSASLQKVDTQVIGDEVS